MTNKELAKLLLDVAREIEPIPDGSEANRQKVVEQLYRIPVAPEFVRDFKAAIIKGLQGGDRPKSAEQ